MIVGELRVIVSNPITTADYNSIEKVLVENFARPGTENDPNVKFYKLRIASELVVN